MSHMVVSVRPGTTFKEIVELLGEHDITAVPVVDAVGRPIGMVSEADLLRKQSGQADPMGRLLTPQLGSEERVKVEATTAEGLMTSPVVGARPDWTVVEAARVMQDRGIKRLPVVDDIGRLIGIVSRSDLLRVFLRRDWAIREEIVEDVLVRTMGEAPSAVGVDVEEGQVTLVGTLARKSLISVLVRLCRSVDGVVGVEHHLDFRLDDTGAPAASRAAPEA
jgi:CBS domain-containing protein